MKGRLNQLPLAMVEVPLAREQALAQQSLGPLHAPSFDKVPVVFDQDLLDIVRMAEQHDPLGPNRKGDDIAVRIRHPCQKTDGITAVAQEMTHKRLALRAGGILE